MAKPLVKLLKEDISSYYKDKEKAEELTAYITDRLFVVSLLETAKISGYPLNWLSADQKEFLEKGGEVWLAKYLNIDYPIYSRDEDYKELSFSYMSSEINKIKEKLGFEDLVDVNLVNIDRILRFKIRPETLRNFRHVFIPLFILYGIDKGYFKRFSEKEKKMLRKISLLFISRFFSEVTKKKRESLVSMGVSNELLDSLDYLLREIKYDYLISKVVTLRKKIAEVKTESEILDTTTLLINKAVGVVKKAYYPYFSKTFKDKTGINLNTLVYTLKKEYISKEKYKNLQKNIDKIKDIPEIREAGDIFEKVLKEKKVKERGEKQVNVFDVEIPQIEREKISEVLNCMVNKGVCDLSSVGEETKERFEKALYTLLDSLNKGDIEKYSVIKMSY